MTEPDVQIVATEQAEEPTPEVQPEVVEPEPGQSPEDDGLPEWARTKLRKANNEAQNLRARLREQEPLVTAAQEAERAQMSELERERSDNAALKAQLAQRDTDVLVSRYQIPEDFIEFIGEGTFEEKEARAAKVGGMVQPKNDTQERPPSDRPVESLKPGASPSTPPVEDHSYPAQWGFMPDAGT